jgi:hypothetical protein
MNRYVKARVQFKSYYHEEVLWAGWWMWQQLYFAVNATTNPKSLLNTRTHYHTTFEYAHTK